MASVESSTIARVDFAVVDTEMQTGTLTVAFKSGQTFRYFDVPMEKYSAFLLSESKGKYFAQSVKKKYRGEKVEATTETDDYGAQRAYGNEKPVKMPEVENPIIEHHPIRMGTIDL